jgi:hypothetical protein
MHASAERRQDIGPVHKQYNPQNQNEENYLEIRENYCSGRILSGRPKSQEKSKGGSGKGKAGSIL